MRKTYKDKCESCNEFKICKGYLGNLLCKDCIMNFDKRGTVSKNKKNINFKQLSIFDIITTN